MNRLQASIAATALAFSSAASAADLTIEVKGIAEAKGTIMIAVYDKAEGWMRKGVKFTRLDAAMPGVVAALKDLPEGTYAVSLYHDVDGNGKLDSNAMRIPIEPYGFSNDAMGMFGPPSFEDARFVVPAAGARIVINLKS